MFNVSVPQGSIFGPSVSITTFGEQSNKYNRESNRVLEYRWVTPPHDQEFHKDQF